MLTTHYLEEAERLADRVAILEGGRIRATGTPEELARESGLPSRRMLVRPTLEEAYLELVGTAAGMS